MDDLDAIWSLHSGDFDLYLANCVANKAKENLVSDITNDQGHMQNVVCTLSLSLSMIDVPE